MTQTNLINDPIRQHVHQVLSQMNNIDNEHGFANIIHIHGLPQDIQAINRLYFNRTMNRIDTVGLLEHNPVIAKDTLNQDDEYTGNIVATLNRFEEELERKQPDIDVLTMYYDTIRQCTVGVYTRLQNAGVEITPERHQWFNSVIIFTPSADTPKSEYPIQRGFQWMTKIGFYNPEITGYDFDHVKLVPSFLAAWEYLDYNDWDEDEQDIRTTKTVTDDDLICLTPTRVGAVIEPLRIISELYDVKIRLLAGNGLMAHAYSIESGRAMVDETVPGPHEVYTYLDILSLVDVYSDKFRYTEHDYNEMDEDMSNYGPEIFVND